VVAYGTAKKSQFTGSATVVKADEISKIQTNNVTNALVGKVTGMQIMNSSGQPGVSSPQVRIRGISSINAGNDPLVIIDGAPYSGDLNYINSLDIESITVLKDAVSNALYGARGSNGVMMITTKKGAAGEARITVDTKWGANTRSIQDYNYVKSPAQYYEMYYGALKSYFINGMNYSPEQAHTLANRNMTLNNDYGLGYNVYNVPAGQYLIGNNGKLNPNATLGNVVSYRGEDYLLTPDNWLGAVYRQSLRQEYNITATTGTDKSSFFASFGYLDNQGITPKSDFKRITGRLKADQQVKSWMKIGANMSYVNYSFNRLSDDGSTGSSGNLFALATRVSPIYPLYIRDGNGNIKYDSNGFQMFDYGDRGNAGLERPAIGQSNALGSLLLDTYGANGNAINTSGFAEITFLNDFKFTTINTVTVNEYRTTSVTNPYYGQYAASNGIVYKAHNRSFDYDFQQLLTYAKDLDVNHLNFLIGHDYSRSQSFYLSAEKSNMFDPSNHELNGAVTDGSPGSYTTDYNTDGYFARALYDYADKYYLSASFRLDATSRFHPDNKWGNFWSAGLAWTISKESFLDHSWINILKLKASYGEQGNDRIGDYRYTDTYTIMNSNGKPAAVPNLKGNKNISWEKAGNFNTGIDFSLFGERLSGSVEYYYRKTSGMLFTFPLPPSYGWSSFYDNIGDMRNKGIEADLKGTLIKTRDFKWDLRLNLTSNNNKIIYLPEERKTMTTVEGIKGYSSGNKFFGEGMSLYPFYLRKFAGVNEKGEALYYRSEKNEAGEYTGETTTVTNPSDATEYLLGTSLPDLFGGFGTGFTYKGFDLSVDFAYQIGGFVYDGDYQTFMTNPQATRKGFAFHADLLNSWTPENTDSNIPRFQFGDLYTTYSSDRFLTDASFLSLQNINVGYTLPARICRSLGMEKLRIYGVCDHVWLWAKRQGLDPRQNVDGSTTSAYYAPVRTFSGGITLTF